MLQYNLTKPCNACPFLAKYMKGVDGRKEDGYSEQRLDEMSCMDFHCHKTGDCDEENSDYIPNEKSSACAGMLIYNEKRNQFNVYAMIAEDAGVYDKTKLDMSSPVR